MTKNHPQLKPQLAALGFCRCCGHALSANDFAPYGPGDGFCVGCTIEQEIAVLETDEALELAESIINGLGQAGRVI